MICRLCDGRGYDCDLHFNVILQCPFCRGTGTICFTSEEYVREDTASLHELWKTDGGRGHLSPEKE